MPRFMPALLGGLLLTAAASALAAPQSPNPTPPPEAAAPAVRTMPVDDLASARRVTAAEVREALAKGQAVLVDVRPKESYDAQHAQGAVTLPLSELDARAGELPKDKLIVTYCT
jgi:3-mercaptopyruvate sulfurtransferase SseA